MATASPASPVALTPDQILAAIPATTGTGQADKELSGMLDQVHKTPQDAIAWVNLGDALAQAARNYSNGKYYDLAGQTYVQALKINPHSVDAMIGMASVAGGHHDFEQSVEWAHRALALDANNAAADGILGDAAMELGNYDEAFDCYQTMMDLKPNPSSWGRGAQILWMTGNRSKAIWLMERAVKAGAPFAENTAWCRAKYAMMLFDDGALVPAMQVLEPALAAAPHNTDVLIAAGRIAAARRDFPAATQYYQKALEAGPSHEVLVGLGDLYAVQGEKAEAEKYYVQVEALHAAHVAASRDDDLLMAKFYADHDRNPAEALRLAEAHKLTKNVLKADTLAWVYFKNGDQTHAIEAMKVALSRNTADGEMQFHAGMIAAAASDRVSAQKHLQQALSYNPHFNLLQAPVAVATLEKLGGPTPKPDASAGP